MKQMTELAGLGQALVVIADKLGMRVDQMYQIILGAQKFMALLKLVMIFVWVIFMIIIVVITAYFVKKECDKASFHSNEILYFFVGVVAAVVVTMGMEFIYQPLVAFFCPEYTALQRLVEILHYLIP